MEDALWRRLLVAAGVGLGAALGLGLAESAVSGRNGFAVLIEGWDSHRFRHPAHVVGLVFGMSIFGAVTISFVVIPLIRRTVLIRERTLRRMISRRGR